MFVVFMVWLLFTKGICNFSAIMRPTTKYLKVETFAWTKKAEEAFKHIKTAMTQPHILMLKYFEKLFLVEGDASHVGIGIVLSQEGRPVSFFSEKLSDAKLLTYALELYALVHAFDY